MVRSADWTCLHERQLRPSPTEVRANDLSASPQLIKVIRPMLHHSNPLIPVLASRVGPANGIRLRVGKLALNCVRVPSAHFVQQSGRHRAEAMCGHLILFVAHPPQRRIDRVVRQGPLGRAHSRE